MTRPRPRPRAAAGERRGAAWVLGAFVACPCHLPLTLAALGAVLGGTAAGALLREHAVTAGILITLVWLAGTARGVWLLRRPPACPVPARGPVAAATGGGPVPAGVGAGRPPRDTGGR